MNRKNLSGIVAGLTLGASLLLMPLNAAACSCVAGGDPWKDFKRAEAAIIGVFEGKRGPTTYRFRVEEDFKVDFGATLDVEAPEHGASCGIELSVGRRTGLYLGHDRGAWRSALCLQRAPDEIRRAAAGLPRPNGKGRVRYLVAGSFGPARLHALDAHGRTLGYGFGAGSTVSLAVCPGGKRVLEMVVADDRSATYVATRELATMRVTSQVRVPARELDYVSYVHCADAAARNGYAFSGTENGGALFRVRGDAVTLVRRGPESAVTFTRTAAFMARSDGVIRLELGTRRARLVTRLGARTDRIAASPSGRYVALVGAGRITLVDTRARKVLGHRLLGPDVFGHPLWIGDGRVVFLPGGGTSSTAHLYDRRLRLLSSFRGWNTSSSVVDGRRVAGVGWGVLQSARLPKGPTRKLRHFFSRATSSIATVGRGPTLRMAASSGCTDP